MTIVSLTIIIVCDSHEHKNIYVCTASFSFGFRGFGVVSMCIGTGMGAAAVFEYPGP